MGHLQDKIAIVTGAGRGIGREHALLMAREGAKVVVNDLGGAEDGSGEDAGPAHAVADEIVAAGGEAIANGGDVSDYESAQRIVAETVDAFGRVDIVVNNAGILRDSVIINTSAADWQVVIDVNLSGTFLVLQAAARHWRDRSKSGEDVAAAVVNTSSESGLFANPGQANYASAKAGVATLTQVAAKELSRYGVRVNAILPRARTRLTKDIIGDSDPDDRAAFDRWEPGHVSPMVAYLCSPSCEMTGEVFLVGGSRVQRIRPWEKDTNWILDNDGRWSLDDLIRAVKEAGAPGRTTADSEAV